MKEHKKFFSTENKLNKGYAFPVNNSEEVNEDLETPIESVSENEEVIKAEIAETNPEITETNPELQKLMLQIESRFHFIGRIFNLLVLAIISYTTIILAKNNYHLLASIFIISSFISIIAISLIPLYKSDNYKKRFNPNFRRYPKRPRKFYPNKKDQGANQS